jgi:dienelactone hydrolase
MNTNTGLSQIGLASLGVWLSLGASAAGIEGVEPAHLQNTQAIGSQSTFQTQPWNNQQLSYAHHNVERVEFNSQGTTVVGNFFVPKGKIKAVIVVMGPVAFVKEQAPMQYASRLVKMDYAVLIFDPRYHGESAGEPRRLESRQAKVEDIQAAIDYLTAGADIENLPIYGLGICQGVNWMIEAATLDKRIQKIAIVAGHYLMPEIANLYLGGADNVAERIKSARAAKEAYRTTGEVKYRPIVSDAHASANASAGAGSLKGSDSKVLLAASVIQQFYQRWADRGSYWDFHGLWENRITQMSEAEIWGHDIRPIAEKLQTPVLMLHADHAASGPQVPRDLFASIPVNNKQLQWLGNRNQMQFYEDPLTIDLVTERLAPFLNQ